MSASPGKPLLVGDPHLSIRSLAEHQFFRGLPEVGIWSLNKSSLVAQIPGIPNFWYEIHGTLRDSQPFALHGVAPPGIPATLIGQSLGFFHGDS